MPEDYKMIYEEIIQIYNKIYFNGKDIGIFYWIVYQTIVRMLDKNIACEKLFIDYGTGGDGKTSAMQALVNCLGVGH